MASGSLFYCLGLLLIFTFIAVDSSHPPKSIGLRTTMVCSDDVCEKKCHIQRKVRVHFGECYWNGYYAEMEECIGIKTPGQPVVYYYYYNRYTDKKCSNSVPNNSVLNVHSGYCYTDPFFGSYYYICQPYWFKTKQDSLTNGGQNGNENNLYLIGTIAFCVMLFGGIICGYLAYKKRARRNKVSLLET